MVRTRDYLLLGQITLTALTNVMAAWDKTVDFDFTNVIEDGPTGSWRYTYGLYNRWYRLAAELRLPIIQAHPMLVVMSGLKPTTLNQILMEVEMISTALVLVMGAIVGTLPYMRLVTHLGLAIHLMVAVRLVQHYLMLKIICVPQ